MYERNYVNNKVSYDFLISFNSIRKAELVTDIKRKIIKKSCEDKISIEYNGKVVVFSYFENKLN